MSTPYILKLNELDKDSVPVAGGKGANLGELIRNGLPVPDGFCVHAAAYQEFVRENGLQGLIQEKLRQIQWSDPASIEAYSAEIRALILERPLSPQVEAGIVRAYQEMNTVRQDRGYVAVRSSATAEDLPDASFAGQQETFLYVKGEQDLLRYLKRCWASLWTARAMAYRNSKNFEHDKVSIAVVIQEMVDATISGILFTTHPLTHNEEELYVTASYGLGEPVVSGLVTPDTFTLDKKSLTITNRHLGAKEKQMLLGPEGQTIFTEVPQIKQEAFSLTTEQLKELGALSKKVADHYQFPQDIEWSYAGETLYLLQARPITTLKSAAAEAVELVEFGKLSGTQIKILDDLLEHYPEPPTPLDYSVVVMSYQSILDRGEELGIRLSPATEMIRMDQDGKVSLHPPQLKLQGKLLFLIPKLVKAARLDHDAWSSMEIEFNSFRQKMQHLQICELSKQSLLREIEDVFALGKKVTDLRFRLIVDSTIIPLFLLTGVVNLFTPKKERSVISDLITTNLPYKTAVIDSRLMELAIGIAQAPEVKKLILGGTYLDEEDFNRKLAALPGGNQVAGHLQAFLTEYGYRTNKMYQPFNSKSWLDDFGYFLDILKAVLNDPQLLERKGKELARNEKHSQWLAGFEQKLTGPIKGIFRNNYEHLRRLYLYREETVFFIEAIFHYGRKLVHELGIRFTSEGLLENPQDIIYLFKEEIADLTLHGGDPSQIREQISKRQARAKANERIWKQSIIQLSQKSNPTDKAIIGISGSNGLAQGTARIITRVEDFKKLKQGEILVCQYTDPAWTPLFGLAAAVVADTGGPLSHAAIVAREYEIPAVLGTKTGTDRITDGEIIIVDGTAGKVFQSA